MSVFVRFSLSFLFLCRQIPKLIFGGRDTYRNLHVSKSPRQNYQEISFAVAKHYCSLIQSGEFFKFLFHPPFLFLLQYTQSLSCHNLEFSRRAHSSDGSVQNLRTRDCWFDPQARPIFFSRIDDNNCDVPL